MTNIYDRLLKTLNEVFPPTQTLYVGIYLCAVSYTEYIGGFKVPVDELLSHGMSGYLKRGLKLQDAAMETSYTNDISDLAEAFANIEKLYDRIYILESPNIVTTLEDCHRGLHHVITSTASLNLIISDMIENERGVSGLSTTPDCICRLAAAVLPRQNYEHIIEFCSGVSLFSAKLMHYLYLNGKVTPTKRISYGGQELDSQLSTISGLLLILNDFSPVKMQNADALSVITEGPFKKSTLILADIAMQENFVYSIRPGDRRFSAYDKQALYYDWALILNILSILEGGGNACVIVTKGALVRQRERRLRELVTRQHQLAAVITLPSSLYPASSLGAELLLLRGENG